VLDLKDVNLAEFVYALDDHSALTEWWFDPTTGELEPWSLDRVDDDGEEHPEERGFLHVEPITSHDGYRDMEEFVERVRDPRARELLARAIEGRGAFRRFKDTLFEFPELRELWFRFRDARMERRAIEWLADAGVLDERSAEEAIAERAEPEPPELSGAFDAETIARAVAADLRELYGARLRKVLLFGSWARGDAHPESDIDLLVVLDRVDSLWDELSRMDPGLWRHSFDNDTVLTALPVAEDDFEERRSPVLARAWTEGLLVG
jgi:hypothetical protein